MIPVHRRAFLQRAAAAPFAFAGLAALTRRAGAAPSVGYGPLVPDPKGILSLPVGFSYRVIARRGQEMSDGLLVPGQPDCMGAFPGPAGSTILVCNHENDVEPAKVGAFGEHYERLPRVDRAKMFDAGQLKKPLLGGTTTLVVETKTLEVKKHFLSLAGTARNCAGGATPWGSWLTCEEDVTPAGDTFEQSHGYVFEVPADAESGLVQAQPIRAMGRFNHEACAVDPASNVVYLTEDRPDGLLYRFIPNQTGHVGALAKGGGRLQALAVQDRPSLDTRNWKERAVRAGESLRVRWVDLEDIEPAKDDLRVRGFEAGAARFARGEGATFGGGAVFFTCTSGGKAQRGQIWKYVPSAEEGRPGESTQPGSLSLFIEPDDAAAMNMCDNLCTAPWGDLVLCEDGEGRDRVLGVTPAGELYLVAQNTLSNSEFAGATFSPDGTTLFVNLQNDGLTLAIQGPWRRHS